MALGGHPGFRLLKAARGVGDDLIGIVAMRADETGGGAGPKVRALKRNDESERNEKGRRGAASSRSEHGKKRDSK